MRLQTHVYTPPGLTPAKVLGVLVQINRLTIATCMSYNQKMLCGAKMCC